MSNNQKDQRQPGISSFSIANTAIRTIVQVFGENELAQHLQKGGPVYDCLISIGNPKRLLGRRNAGQFMPRLFRRSFRRILRLGFFDVESPDQLGPMRPKRVATIRDINRVIRFFKETKNYTQGYTLHCWHGVSRSAAVALGILYLISGSESFAKAELRRARPEAMPLRLVVRLFDSKLGSSLASANEAIFSERIEEIRKELDQECDNMLEELPEATDED